MFDLSSYGVKSPLRELYESALQGYKPQIAKQVEELARQEAIEPSEDYIRFTTERIVVALLLSSDDELAAFFGDTIPEALRPQPVDLEVRWLYEARDHFELLQ
jgi:hypothetical protein